MGWRTPALALPLCLALAACGGDPYAPLRKQLETARAEGCVVTENGDVTAGQEAWRTFCETAWAGDDAEVRLADWYDAADSSPACLYFQTLAFDGEGYTITHEYGKGDGGEPWQESYTELLRFSYTDWRDDGCTAYFLTNDPELTLADISRSETASLESAQADAHCVYTERVPKTGGTEIETP